MSGYLARLKARNHENQPPGEPSKPSKASFEPFEGADGGPILLDSDRKRLLGQVRATAIRRNADAVLNGSTDRWCDCGARASFAWPSVGGHDRWRCLECGPALGRS